MNYEIRVKDFLYTVGQYIKSPEFIENSDKQSLTEILSEIESLQRDIFPKKE